MSKIFLLVAALFLCAGIAGSREVTVGVNAEFMPFEFVDDDGKIVGFDIDMIHAIADAAGLEIVIRDQIFETLLASLDAGELDLLISGITITPERQSLVDFSRPYYRTAQVVVVREASATVASLDDLKDKRVGVQPGTTGALMVVDALGAGNPGVRPFQKFSEAFRELEGGALDAVVVDMPVAEAYLRRVPGLKIGSEAMSREEYGIAVRKGNAELLGKINAGLDAIRESGEFDDITEKWFQN